MGTNTKYDAFISYSNRQDSKLAPALETALEKFAKPTFKRRALEIFRDSNDLSASPDLWGKIEEGLDRSSYFVFLASPEAAQSRWCRKEIDHWLRMKSIDQFLLVITEGEWVWDEEACDFDWEQTTALPRNLSGAFKNEPLFVDFRGTTRENELTLDHPDFRDKVVRLAATIHGKAVGDMVGEAVTQHKRTMRIRNTAIAALSTLLVAATVLGIYATYQKGVAESETRRALLTSYISASQAQLNEDPTKSLRLAEYAYRYAENNDLSTEEAAKQLIKVFYSGAGFYQQPGDEPATPAENEEPGNAECLALLNRVIDSDPNRDERSIDCTVSMDRSNFLIAGGDMDFPLLYFVEDPVSETNPPIEIKLEGFSGYTGEIMRIAMSSNSQYSLLGARNSRTALIDNEAYRNDTNNADTFKVRAILKTGASNPVAFVGFTEDDQYIVTRNQDLERYTQPGRPRPLTTHIWQTAPFPYIEIHLDEDPDNPEFDNSSISGAHNLAPAEHNERDDSNPFTWSIYEVELRDEIDALVTEFPDASQVPLSRATSPSGNFSVSYQGIFDREDELLVTLNTYTMDNPLIFYSFSKDGNFLKLGDFSLARIFPLSPESILERVNDPEIMGNIAKLSEEDNTRFLIEPGSVQTER